MARPVRLSSPKRLQALGRLPIVTMNKTEQRYSLHLEAQRQLGEILWWKFEGITLKLARSTHLNIDFAVMTADRELRMVDVKGSAAVIQDDTWAKIKIAAGMYPFAFFLAIPAKGQKGQWEMREVIP